VRPEGKGVRLYRGGTAFVTIVSMPARRVEFRS
jgi:hypothetical protein